MIKQEKRKQIHLGNIKRRKEKWRFKGKPTRNLSNLRRFKNGMDAANQVNLNCQSNIEFLYYIYVSIWTGVPNNPSSER